MEEIVADRSEPFIALTVMMRHAFAMLQDKGIVLLFQVNTEDQCKTLLSFRPLSDQKKYADACIESYEYFHIGNGYCQDELNNEDCAFDGGDCCMVGAYTNHCKACECISE